MKRTNVCEATARWVGRFTSRMRPSRETCLHREVKSFPWGWEMLSGPRPLSAAGLVSVPQGGTLFCFWKTQGRVLRVLGMQTVNVFRKWRGPLAPANFRRMQSRVLRAPSLAINHVFRRWKGYSPCKFPKNAKLRASGTEYADRQHFSEVEGAQPQQTSGK